MKSIIILLFLTSTNLFAAQYKVVTKSFLLSAAMDPQRPIFYNCFRVEKKIKGLLEKLGAKEISVECSGGMDNFNVNIPSRAFVSTSFKALQKKAEDNITITSTESVDDLAECYLLSTAFRSLKNSFPVSNVRTRGCFHPTDRVFITFDVLKEVK